LDKADNFSRVYGVLNFPLQQFNSGLSRSYAVDYVYVSATHMALLIEARKLKGQH
jgi:hypothetical protein